MPERRDHGFLYDIAEAFKRDLNYEYRGLERGFAEGLSLALAEAFLHGSRPPQELRQAITNELLRKGWATNIAGAVAQGMFTASLQNNYASLTDRLDAEAKQGSRAAQLTLGCLYASGRAGLAQSDATAARSFRIAAEQGDAAAQYNLGVFYYLGRGVAQSDTLAAQWFACAAAQNDAEAQSNLGLMYYFGQGVEQSFARAVELFQQAADRGLPDAQCRLGGMYQWGMGVPRNEALAERWLTASAQQGYAKAQCNLGLISARRERYTDARAWRLDDIAPRRQDQLLSSRPNQVPWQPAT
jgi:TPR repeat protein